MSLRVQPRAGRDEVGEAVGPALRVKVTAPPVDSAANEAVLRLLAKRLRQPRGKFRLVRGLTSRSKVVEVSGMAAAAIVEALLHD